MSFSAIHLLPSSPLGQLLEACKRDDAVFSGALFISQGEQMDALRSPAPLSFKMPALLHSQPQETTSQASAAGVTEYC